MSNTRFIIAVAALVAVGIGTCHFCRDVDLAPDRAIAELVERAVAAAEDGDASALVDEVSDDFSGQAGGGARVNRSELQLNLAFMMRRTGGVNVSILSQELELRGDEATLELTLILIPKRGRGLLEGDAAARTLELGLRLEGDDWKVVSSRHRPAELGDAF